MRFILITSGLILASCGNSGTNTSKTDSGSRKSGDRKTSTGAASVAVNQQLTSFAHFIAGMKDSNPVARSSSAVWKSYSASNEAKWKTLKEKIGGKIEGWVQSNPQEVKGEPNTLFYPFAGGDFYYANLFFPKQDTIIMIGLEPGGSIFDPAQVKDSSINRYYKNLEHTMYFPHWLGFFRTKSMAVDFNRGPLNGTIHTVLFYLARFGYNINYIEHFNLDNAGNETEVTDGSKISGKLKRSGYRVGYSKPGSNEVKVVTYISWDASDGYLKTHTGLMNWLQKRGKVVTFFKAASYLMHEDYFSTVRNFVASHSVRVFQDDSGLPYQFMLDNGFDVKLLGVYNRTIKLFSHKFQPEMKKAYQKAKPEVLPFMIGYNAEFRECNMQSAVKK